MPHTTPSGGFLALCRLVEKVDRERGLTSDRTHLPSPLPRVTYDSLRGAWWRSRDARAGSSGDTGNRRGHPLSGTRETWVASFAPPFAPRKVLHDAASPAPNRKRPWQRQPPLEISEALSGRFNRVTGEIRDWTGTRILPWIRPSSNCQGYGGAAKPPSVITLSASLILRGDPPERQNAWLDAQETTATTGTLTTNRRSMTFRTILSFRAINPHRRR